MYSNVLKLDVGNPFDVLGKTDQIKLIKSTWSD